MAQQAKNEIGGKHRFVFNFQIQQVFKGSLNYWRQSRRISVSGFFICSMQLSMKVAWHCNRWHHLNIRRRIRNTYWYCTPPSLHRIRFLMCKLRRITHSKYLIITRDPPNLLFTNIIIIFLRNVVEHFFVIVGVLVIPRKDTRSTHN